jgi:hypothetical protein
MEVVEIEKPRRFLLPGLFYASSGNVYQSVNNKTVTPHPQAFCLQDFAN